MPGTTHIYRGQILDTITQLPPPDTVLRLCDALDIECMTPIGDDIIPNAEGIYEATVPSGFEGYFEITSSTTVPQILWIPGVVTEDVLDIGVPLQLVSPGIRDTLISTAGFEYDETRGIVLLVATDCNEDPAAGISFGLSTSDTETIVFYLYNLLPQLEVDGTDESGFGGFFNAPTGISTMTATRNETSELIAEQQFLIRAGWISAVAAGAGGGLQ
jgi:hypothetical protein